MPSENTQSHNLKALIESLLFVSEKPVTVLEIAKVTAQPEKVIVDSLESLIREYEASGGGLRILNVAGGYQLCTAPEHAEWIKKFCRYRFSQRLSTASLEALAIIAYKQPVTKAEVEAIRGVNMDQIMKNLLKSRLIKMSGRKSCPGRPFLYGTTSQFLEFFGLRSLKDLPPACRQAGQTEEASSENFLKETEAEYDREPLSKSAEE